MKGIRSRVSLAAALVLSLVTPASLADTAGANFPTSGITVDEGVGVVNVSVRMVPPFNGPVTYSVSGTASASDFGTLSGTVLATGAEAVIRVPITNDGEASEELETIVLALGSGSGYVVGPLTQFQINIEDNDGAWVGHLENGQGKIGVTLRLIDSVGTVTGTLVSDGGGTFPAGSYPLAVIRNATTFSASLITPIQIAGGDTAFGAPMTRNLSLTAAQSNAGQRVERTLLRGRFTEQIRFNSAANRHLDPPDVHGDFTLMRELTRPSTQEPTLVVP